MATDEAIRVRVLAAASDLFTAQGYGATTVDQVARAAGTSARAVRRLVGGKVALLEAVLADRGAPPVAAAVEAAVSNPDLPPLSTLLAAAHALLTDPRTGWDPLDLEALARAAADEELRTIAGSRLVQRSRNVRAVIRSSRKAGGVDPDLSDDAAVHLFMALSIGTAMLDPVAERRPTAQEWDALIARIGSAVAPQELLLEPEYEPGSRWRIRVDIPDRPGSLARLVRALASLHGYTSYLQVVEVGEGVRTIDVGLVAPPTVSQEAVLAAARSAGSTAYITTGGRDEPGRDLLARTLDGATRLVKHPEEAPRVAAALVAAEGVEVIDATAGSDDRADVLRLQWTANRHVLLHRSWAPFARTERARASAVLRLSAAIARLSGTDEAAGWIEELRNGSTAWIRLARPEDADLVAAMHERCSERSRYQRYFSLTEWRDVQLRRLTGGHRGATLVVMSREGDIVGLGNVFPEAPGDGGAAEIALIVEDAQQGSGIGTVLLRRMLQVAAGIGFGQVVAHVLADNTGMMRMLERTGLGWTTSVTEGVAHMIADLPQLPRPSDLAVEVGPDEAARR